MSTVAAEPKITPEEFLALPDKERFELVDGQLAEVNVSVLSSLVGGRVYYTLQNHFGLNDLGYVWPADLYLRCFADPNKLRKPDVTFIAKDRLTAEILDEGYLITPPDLVVEVVSPNDLAYEIDEKVQEYLDAGVQLVWVVNPALHTVRIHRADGTITGLHESDDLSGENVVPGFRCSVATFFPSRPASAIPPSSAKG